MSADAWYSLSRGLGGPRAHYHHTAEDILPWPTGQRSAYTSPMSPTGLWMWPGMKNDTGQRRASPEAQVNVYGLIRSYSRHGEAWNLEYRGTVTAFWEFSGRLDCDVRLGVIRP